MASCKQESTKDLKGVKLGKATIYCDESLRKIVSQHEEIFESDHKYADLNIKYIPESEVLKSFLIDTNSVAIISHALDTNLVKGFNKRKILPRQYRFGKSAIAFITNISNQKAQFHYKEIVEALKTDNSSLNFAIENQQSGIALELLNHTKTEKLGNKVYALKSKNAIIDWLQQNPSGIGLIDWSELSDSDDVEAQNLLKKIKLIGIQTDSSKGEFVKPYQGNLNGLYPFTRDLYFIRKFGVADVSLGFASFICEERGQRIMLKAGLLPEYQTERWIEFKGLKDVKVVK